MAESNSPARRRGSRRRSASRRPVHGFLLATLLLLAWPPSAHPQPAPAAAAAEAAADAADAGLEARIDSLFAGWDRPGSPGAAVAVLKDGVVVLERGYGSAQLEHAVPVTPQTVFHVASVTKQFTAFGVAMLAEAGRLSLNDDVRTHIPELPDLGHRLTLRQLIHHTSGIRDQWELLAMAGWRLDDVITKDHILAMAVRQRELNFEPGAEHLYSNMGYTLLAEVVERVGGAPFPEWMREHVFDPLGMRSTHMHDDHQMVVPGRAYSYAPIRHGGSGRGPAPAGEPAAAAPAWRNAVLSYANAGATSLFTTAGDLARWLRNFETAEVGGPAVVAQMRERAVLNDGDTIAYAFAIARGEHRGRTTWSHGGADAGFRSNVLHIPEERLGVVVLSNAASFNAAGMARRVADVVLGLDEEAPRVAGRPMAGPTDEAPDPGRLPEAAALAAYTGVYYSPELETLYRVDVRDDALVLAHVRHGDVPLEQRGEDVFTGGRWPFGRVAFERDGAGRVDGFRLTGGRVRNLRFVRLPEGALP